MDLTLSPMDSGRLAVWLERTTAEYVDDLVRAGESLEAAKRHAEESLVAMFPDGRPLAHHAVVDLVDSGGTVVGYLWVGPDTSDDASAWWVWDIAIAPVYRGQGYGREAMGRAERYARDHGARTLGLHVFGFNAAARALYESLGYETTSVRMRKAL